MARITSKSGKLQQMKRRQLYGSGGTVLSIRLFLMLSLVSVILLMAYLLYQTDLAMKVQRNQQQQNNDRSMKKNILFAQHMSPGDLLTLKNAAIAKESEGIVDDGKNSKKNKNKKMKKKREKSSDGGRRRVELDLMNLKSNNGGGGMGTITIETVDEWAPLGVQRFWELIVSEYYLQCAMFRVVPNFIAQFGIASTSTMHAKWEHKTIMDDPVIHPNLQHTVTFAMSGKDTRTTQLFINMKDNTYLDGQGFAPFGKIVSGSEYISQINDQYKELPNQNKITKEGNDYLNREFPGLTYISAIRILGDDDDDDTSNDDNEEKSDNDEGNEKEEGDGDDGKNSENEGDDKQKGDDQDGDDKNKDGDDKNKDGDDDKNKNGDDKEGGEGNGGDDKGAENGGGGDDKEN